MKYYLTTVRMVIIKKSINTSFPSGSVLKNLPANAGDADLIPGLGRSHMPCN